MSETTTARPVSSGTPPAPDRMLSLDALRGFDMFWIIGADSLVGALNKVGGDHGVLKVIATQLDHVEWEGFHFYDMIFPMFVFIIGVSIVLSIDRIVDREGIWGAHKRIIRRGFILYIISLLYYGGFGRKVDPGGEHGILRMIVTHLEHSSLGGVSLFHYPIHILSVLVTMTAGFRFVGVMQRLALSYMIGALLYVNLGRRGLNGLIGLIAVFFVIMLGYWAMLALIPAGVPGHIPAGGLTHASFEPGQNLTNYFDWRFLPGRRWDKEWDPEGILSSIPAVATCLLGIFAGLLFKNPAVPKEKKGIYLIAAGIVMVLLGFMWSSCSYIPYIGPYIGVVHFPIIKKIWTSSYVLVAGGYSSILLGTFYLVIDVLGFRKWATPFVWIGSNALAIYLLTNFFDFDKFAERFVGGSVHEHLHAYGDLVVTIVSLSFAIYCTYWLYKRRIFIKV